MRFIEAVRLAIQTIRTQKLKSVFSIIGVFPGGFGLYPASRAARLDPVEALRYE